MRTAIAAVASLCLLGAFPAARAAAADAKPEAAGAEKPGKAQLQKSYSKTVRRHVAEASRKSGAFVVHDDKLDKDWRLKLVRIHTDRIVQLADDTFFACADLKEPEGKKTKLDLDFYVVRKGGDWVMDKVLVHKVAGKPRYTYNDKNEMVPVP